MRIAAALVLASLIASPSRLRDEATGKRQEGPGDPAWTHAAAGIVPVY